MKLLIDFAPIAVFFVAYKLWDIWVATGVAIAATIVQIAYLRWSTGKVEPMQWLSLAIIVVFGGATIALHDPVFIQWKPSILYWAFAVVLAFGQVVLKKNLLKAAMGSQVELPEHAWKVLTWSWTGFFAAMGALNLYVAKNYSEQTWVNFKVFGLFALMVVFVIGQAIYMSRLVKDEPAADAAGSGNPLSTGITAEALREKLQRSLAPTQLEVLDESWQHAGHAGADGSGFGTHFRVRIDSPRFAGLSRVARHRLVYDALRESIDAGLHALAIETP